MYVALVLALTLRPEAVAAGLLHAWDERRAAAYAVGDPSVLRPLYVPGSPAGRADRALLQEYDDRGLRVVGLRTQLLAVEVLRRADGAWTLRVTDRLVGGTAVGRGERVVLPRDRASTWRIRLVRRDGAWLVAQARPAASTASTSASRNR